MDAVTNPTILEDPSDTSPLLFPRCPRPFSARPCASRCHPLSRAKTGGTCPRTSSASQWGGREPTGRRFPASLTVSASSGARSEPSSMGSGEHVHMCIRFPVLTRIISRVVYSFEVSAFVLFIPFLSGHIYHSVSSSIGLLLNITHSISTHLSISLSLRSFPPSHALFIAPFRIHLHSIPLPSPQLCSCYPIAIVLLNVLCHGFHFLCSRRSFDYSLRRRLRHRLATSLSRILTNTHHRHHRLVFSHLFTKSVLVVHTSTLML